MFNSDALFETGSDAISSTDSIDGVIRLINRLYVGGTIQVRGHTDATGAAGANQGLSERRAANVRDYLKSHGTNARDFSSVGIGSTRPLAEEHNPDGSPNVDGQRFNRRVEIVVRNG